MEIRDGAGMTEKEMKKLIAQGESETLEFKESLKLLDEIGETVSAFSNTKGGIISVGISDKSKVIGVSIGRNTIEDLVNYIKRHTDPQVFPSVKVEKIERKDIVAIEISEAKEKPVFFKGHAWKRVGKSNLALSASEIRKLAKEKEENVFWDEQICENATLKDIDISFVQNSFIPLYEMETKKKIVGPPIRFIEGLGCIKNNKPTNAGILLFGKDLQKFFMNSYITLVKYRGKAVTGEALDRKNFVGNLFQQIDECDKYIKGQMAMMSRLLPDRVQRMDIPEYPPFSIREVITNAVVHRDHSEQHTKVIIKMFDDRIEVYNPGGLPKDITPKNITEKQFSRNPTITGALSKVKYIEEVGEGWDKIIEEHKGHPLKPKLPKISSDVYTTNVTLFSTKEKFAKPEVERFRIKLNERQKKALEFVDREGKITNREYRKLFIGITDRTVLNDLTDMVRKRLLKRVGKRKGAYYIIPK